MGGGGACNQGQLVRRIYSSAEKDITDVRKAGTGKKDSWVDRRTILNGNECQP